MSRYFETNQIVGIDIGSGSIKSIIGEIESNGVINVVGVGKSYSKGGIKKGNVVSISQTVKAIEESIEAATNMATAEATQVVITISGDHIKGVNSKSVMAVNGEEITEIDVDKVLQKCKESFPKSKEVIHVIPQEYIVDEQRGIKNPIGMSGNSLEAKVHVALANASAARNLVNCVNQNEIEVLAMVFAPIASSHSVLTSDEKELGVVLVDIGYATSTISAYKDGSLLFSHILPVGGYNITNDLALSLQIPIEAAEKLKIQYGYAISSEIGETQMVELDNGEQIPLQLVSEVIEARVSELFLLIQEDLKKANIWDEEIIPSGIVITGGTSNLNGIQKLAEEIYKDIKEDKEYKKSVRIGFPHKDIRGLTDLIKHPEYAAAVGLLHYAKENNYGIENDLDREGPLKKMKDLFKKIF